MPLSRGNSERGCGCGIVNSEQTKVTTPCPHPSEVLLNPALSCIKVEIKGTGIKAIYLRQTPVEYPDGKIRPGLPRAEGRPSTCPQIKDSCSH